MHPRIERGIARVTTGLLSLVRRELPFEKTVVEAEEQVGVQVGKKACIVHNVRSVHPCHDSHSIIYRGHGGRGGDVHNAIALELTAIEFYRPAEKSVRGPIGLVRGQRGAITGRIENGRIIVITRGISCGSTRSLIEIKFKNQVRVVCQRYTGPYLYSLRKARDTVGVHGEEHIIAWRKKLPLRYGQSM